MPKRMPTALQDLNPVLARVLAVRGIQHAEDIGHELDALHRPTQAGLARATAILADVVMTGRRLTIIGDFDADGATSTALAMEAFHMMGAPSVDYLVPNRFEYGYGLTPEIVAVAAERGAEVLMTVDNGISSVDGVEAATRLGIPVVITDHHLPGEQLPAAAAIVNPNQQGCAFPSKALAGVGVVFYVMTALRATLAKRDWFTQCGLKKPHFASLLDLVALGTIADLVPLDRNNRILVQQGLRRIRAGQVRPGIAALMGVGKRELSRAVSSDLAFAVAPRLNAAGRLDDMSHGIECLLAKDETTARAYAAELDQLNRERKDIEASMQAEALAALNDVVFSASSAPAGICLYDPSWHQGVIGILAARVKERYHRPVVVFAEASEDSVKGSARSIPGVHLRDVLAEIDALNPGLITKFGGHAMAAGLTLRKASLETFRTAFATRAAHHFDVETLVEQVLTDGPLDAGDVTLTLANTLVAHIPWGQQFEEPQFDNVFKVCQHRVLGDKHVKVTVQMPGSLQTFEGIAFNAVDYWPFHAEWVRVVYRLSENHFRGVSTVQLMIVYAEPSHQ
ncbi:MAG: single-stranded-DNA-specific exonuclease RecJ [Gammaproteobacteria bacterium]